MTELREKIAKALHGKIVDEARARLIDIEVHDAGVSIAFERRLADAVLAVLVDLPDDVIERAAKGFYESSVILGVQPSWDRLCEGSPEIAVNYRRHIRGAFRAAFGGSENDEH